MTTPSVASPLVLERDISVAAAKPVIDLACPLLRELVDHGTSALIQCNQMSPRSADGRFACHALYRHIIEMTDGIEVLISQCCAKPAVPALRSSFEGLLYLTYILEDNSKYAQRSDSWFVNSIRQWLSYYDLTNRGHNRGRAFHEALKRRTTQPISLPHFTPEDVASRPGNFRKLLAEPQYQAIETEFKRQKKSNPNWYTLFGGPQNLQELARKLQLLPEYEVLYRQWSKTAHAQEHMNFFGPSRGEQSFMARLREQKDLPLVSLLAVAIMEKATRRMLRGFRPDEDIEPWCREQVKPRLDQLQKLTGQVIKERDIKEPLKP